MDWNEKRAAYYEKLKDPRWQQKRLRILDRDAWTCQVCSRKDKTLHVHHIAYAPDGADPWDGSESLLITLCEDCHEVEGSNHRQMLYTLLDVLATAGIRTSLDLFHVLSRAGPVIADLNQEAGNTTSCPIISACALGAAIDEWPNRKAGFIADGTYYANRK